MKTTINYGLKKPEGTDVVNIEDLNYNADVIDQKIKEVDTKASNIKVPVTSVNGKTGAVTLAASDVGAVPTGRKVNNKPLSADITLSANDIKTSSGETVESQLAQLTTKQGDLSTLKTTAKTNLVGAVNELFQSASEGKTKIATAITNKGVQANSNDTFPTLANKIGQIETGYGVGEYIPESNLKFGFKEIWETPHSDRIYSIKKDLDGNFINGTSYRTLIKISSDGKEIWRLSDYESSINSVSIDKENNIFTTGFYNSIRKVSPQGREIWKYTGFGESPTALDVDSLGNVISGGGWDSDFSVRKIDKNGKLVWSYTGYDARVKAIAINEEDNVYIGGTVPGSSSRPPLHYIDKNGVLINSTYVDGSIDTISTYSVGENRGIYTGGGSWILHRFSSNLGWGFQYKADNWIYSVSADSNGDVLVGLGSGKVIKMDYKGNLTWTYSTVTSGVHSVLSDGNYFVTGAWNRLIRTLIGYEVLK